MILIFLILLSFFTKPVLAASDLFVTPTPTPNDNPSSQIISIIFIFLGAIFLGISLVISKIKKNEIVPQP